MIGARECGIDEPGDAFVREVHYLPRLPGFGPGGKGTISAPSRSASEFGWLIPLLQRNDLRGGVPEHLFLHEPLHVTLEGVSFPGNHVNS